MGCEGGKDTARLVTPLPPALPCPAPPPYLPLTSVSSFAPLCAPFLPFLPCFPLLPLALSPSLSLSL